MDNICEGYECEYDSEVDSCSEHWTDYGQYEDPLIFNLNECNTYNGICEGNDELVTETGSNMYATTGPCIPTFAH
jgi:hypothetical protein